MRVVGKEWLQKKALSIMERDFGFELAKAFGARMKRLYELDETALPTQIDQWLERLRRAEQELARRSRGNRAEPGSAPDRA
ncbi:hypothetical protein W911_16200 [Hyphomicrobium nitrativorans NL23]|uniref:Uncharacterized protein n=1 Tax=Hyphomicrobium nitrativorans NL23 TaxID=1029756 RepID=V5SHS2_9HYPH|nr:hypothetical protein W911_16200 [Hyphomicrobium nitrativorans NL23]